jgi:hypothetical protein
MNHSNCKIFGLYEKFKSLDCFTLNMLHNSNLYELKASKNFADPISLTISSQKLGVAQLSTNNYLK